MNLILLFKEDYVDGGRCVCLRDRRHQYVRTIHRAGAGDSLCVGEYGGRIGTGKITSIDDRQLEMDVQLDREPPPALALNLILALPRPVMCNRILATASMMGVKQIYLIHSKRVEKSFWKSPVLKDEHIRHQLLLGLEQSKDTIEPKVHKCPLFKPFVEDELTRIARGTLGLVAHPGGAEVCPRDVQKPVTLAIGPEGGFIPYEIEMLQKAGLVPVRVSDRILRVEVAVPVLLSRLF